MDGKGLDNDNITVSKVFAAVCIVVVLVCLAGMIICGYIFYETTKTFSAECSEVLLKIASGATSTEISATSAEIETFTAHMENIVAIQRSGMTNDLMSFIYGILSTILVGLCAGFVVKSQANADEVKNKVYEIRENLRKAENQAATVIEKASDAKTAINEAKSAASEAQKATREAKVNAENAEDQANRVARKANETEIAIKQALDASKEARENAQKAENKAKEVVENAKEIEEVVKQVQLKTEAAKENTLRAEKHAYEAVERAKEIKDVVAEAQTATEEAKENAKKTEENAERTAEIVTGLVYQVRLVTVSSKILYAQSLLFELDHKKAQANRAIKQIEDEITSLFSDKEFIKKKNNIDIMEIEKVYDQLNDLQQIIDSISNTLENKYEGAELKSMEDAIRNYKSWINNAIESMFKSNRDEETKV